MIVLGIDPGPAKSAWCVWDTQTRRVCGFAWENNPVVLLHLRERAWEFYGILLPRSSELAVQGIHLVAVEQIASYGMPVGREVFATCEWSGRFREAWEYAGGSRVLDVTRVAVKLYLCHSARAKDANVRQALLDAVGPRGTKGAPGPTYGITGDVWSALAVAVTAAAQRA